MKSKRVVRRIETYVDQGVQSSLILYDSIPMEAKGIQAVVEKTDSFSNKS